jgi:hypothetical protein
MNAELEGMWKEVSWKYCNSLSQNLPEGTETIMKNLRIVVDPVEIRNEYVPNTSVGRYHCNNPVDAVMACDASGKQTSAIQELWQFIL